MRFGRLAMAIGFGLLLVGGAIAWLRRAESHRVVAPRSTRSSSSSMNLPRTKKELYELARQRHIAGRSTMTKAELEAALRGSL